MREAILGPANPAARPKAPLRARSLDPRLLLRKSLFVGILFLFSGTHNVLTILAPGGATVDPNASADVTVGGVAESDSIPGPLKTLVWCVAGVLLSASQLGKVFRLAKEMPMLTGISLLALASTLWSVVPPESLQHGQSLLLSTLLAYLFIAEFEPEAQMEIVILIGWIAVLGSIAVAVFLPQYGVDQVYNLGEWRGIYAQKNACAAAMLLFMAPLFCRKPGWSTASMTAYGVAVFFVLAKTQSRNGWVTAVAVVFSMVLIRLLARFKTADRRALFVVGFWLVAGCAWVLVTSTGALLSALGRDATFTGRTGIWDVALRAIGDRPILGYGFRAFWSGPFGASTVLYGQATTKHAHNGLLELALGIGLVGVALFIASLIMVVRDIGTCLRPDRPYYVDWYVGTIVAITYFSVAEPFLVLDKSLSWVLYVVACVGLKHQAQKLRNHDPDAAGRRMMQPRSMFRSVVSDTHNG